MSSVSHSINEICYRKGPILGNLLAARPSGLNELECWAILCQAVQALQDLFLSDGASGDSCIPLITPATLVLSSKGRVKLCQSNDGEIFGCNPQIHLIGYLAPEYRRHKQYSDTEIEKMWIYALGVTLKRATLTSHSATLRLSRELCQVLTDMTKLQVTLRASLMHLLDVISEYCQKRHQNRPFSHIVMDLHQEAMAAIEAALDNNTQPWGPPAMPELRPRTRNGSETNIEGINTIPRRWVNLRRNKQHLNNLPKITKEASTSMEDLSQQITNNVPGSILRPKSMCLPDMNYFHNPQLTDLPKLSNNFDHKRLKVRRNPINRAASRLYRATSDHLIGNINKSTNRDCIGPEFVVRASLPNKQYSMPDLKNANRKIVTVIMLNGQKLDVTCNLNATTAGQLFELIIQKECIDENFMLGLSALIAGDFVFLPFDTRICKAVQGSLPHNNTTNLTLFMRVRFFLPSLRGIRNLQTRHLLYLQLRRSILEHQLPCSVNQLIELNGFALQAEFGNYNEREHGVRDYFLMEHYIPETMLNVNDLKLLRRELIQSHISKCGFANEKAEEDFILLAQNLPHYGGHFYTATWILKDNNKDIWLYISAQGINLYERGKSNNFGPTLYEKFEWRIIQTLCYSKHYLCILPSGSRLKKYKLKMDHKKSYFAFRLASLHHQFFLRLRTELTSLNSLSQQFGIPLKDMKNETNSLYKLESFKTNPDYMTLDQATVNAQTEFKIEFRLSSTKSSANNGKWNEAKCKKSKSINDFTKIPSLENIANKENNGLILDSYYLSGLTNNLVMDKRRGVKMGTKVFGSKIGSRSMEMVNCSNNDYLEEMSLQSVSLHCSSTSISKSPFVECAPLEAYILDSSIKSVSNNQLLPNFQETVNETLEEKLNNLSFAEERILSKITIERSENGSLGIQITEGSDGNVYIQSVINRSPAHLSGKVSSGDQIIAVNGHSLLGMKYDEALNLLKRTKNSVEFVLSRVAPTRKTDNLRSKMDLTEINESHMKMMKLENTMNKLRLLYPKSPVEKHLFENCSENLQKKTIPYHKHIRYEIEPESQNLMFNKNLSKSCSEIAANYENGVKLSKFCSLDRRDNKVVPKLRNKFSSLGRQTELPKFQSLDGKKYTIPPPIALPRSLGLGRKWRGPVRYPVTPIRKTIETTNQSTSDDDQVFI